MKYKWPGPEISFTYC